MRPSSTYLLLLSLTVCSCATTDLATAQTITFRKIADTNTPVPGGTGNFVSFVSDPVIDNGNVAFVGSSAYGDHGIYTDLGGTLRVVADNHTQAPGGTEVFTSAWAPSIDDGSVAFRGKVHRGTSYLPGIYLETAGTITVVADTNTPAPGASGNFTYFAETANGYPSLDNGNVAFAAGSSLGLSGGVYARISGIIQKVADVNTPVPGGTGNFSSLMRPSISGTNVAFSGFDSAPGEDRQQGIYTNIGGTISMVADGNTPIPGGTGNFENLFGPAIDGEDVAFAGTGPDDQMGNYTFYDGILDLVMAGSPYPKAPALDNRIVALHYGGGVIYTNIGGSMFRLIGSPDTFDGKTISLAYRGHEGLSGNQIVFFVYFTDDSQGIYVATIQLDCGNGLLDEYEECDHGAATPGCDADCTFVVCGDDTLNTVAGEHCDDGPNNSDTIPDACRTNCMPAFCGDGTVDSGEECDDGNNVDADGCQGACKLPYCGDTIIDPGEQCDDGPANSGVTSDACRQDCALPGCGDGVLDTGESCDDGAGNSDVAPNACRTDCTPASCGDGVVYWGEECDDGTNNSATAPDACRTDCALPVCGDGVVDTGEECDDGNDTDYDACSMICEENDAIPTVSAWGLLIMALMMLTASKVYSAQRLADSLAH